MCVPTVARCRDNRIVLEYGCVVDQNPDWTKRCPRFRQQAFHGCFVGKIGRESHGRTATKTDLVDKLLGRGVRGIMMYRDGIAGLCKTQGERAADAAGSTSNQRRFRNRRYRETPVHLPEFCAIRPGHGVPCSNPCCGRAPWREPFRAPTYRLSPM